MIRFPLCCASSRGYTTPTLSDPGYPCCEAEYICDECNNEIPFDFLDETSQEQQDYHQCEECFTDEPE